jgi:hypothetical protein
LEIQTIASWFLLQVLKKEIERKGMYGIMFSFPTTGVEKGTVEMIKMECI